MMKILYQFWLKLILCSQMVERNHIQYKNAFIYIINAYNEEIIYTPANPSFTI